VKYLELASFPYSLKLYRNERKESATNATNATKYQKLNVLKIDIAEIKYRFLLTTSNFQLPTPYLPLKP
jgi:hypothetical protein